MKKYPTIHWYDPIRMCKFLAYTSKILTYTYMVLSSWLPLHLESEGKDKILVFTIQIHNYNHTIHYHAQIRSRYKQVKSQYKVVSYQYTEVRFLYTQVRSHYTQVRSHYTLVRSHNAQARCYHTLVRSYVARSDRHQSPGLATGPAGYPSTTVCRPACRELHHHQVRALPPQNGPRYQDQTGVWNAR